MKLTAAILILCLGVEFALAKKSSKKSRLQQPRIQMGGSCTDPPQPAFRTVGLHIYWKDNLIKSYSSDSEGTWKNLNDFPDAKGKRIKVGIHGWAGDAESSKTNLLRDGYKNHEDVYLAMFDWGPAACGSCGPLELVTKYWFSAKNVYWAGIKVSEIIKEWLSSGRATANQFHFIGFSFGAHVAGVAGNDIKNSKGVKIARITGLDAARMCFEDALIICGFFKKCESLDTGDAEFVDIIHSDMGLFGHRKPLGHVDFYPNGGIVQPGCSGLKKDICSHFRAVELFVDSINPTPAPGASVKSMEFASQHCSSYKDFQSGQCSDDFAPMGEHVNPQRHSSQVYYLKTNAKEPYSIQL